MVRDHSLRLSLSRFMVHLTQETVFNFLMPIFFLLLFFLLSLFFLCFLTGSFVLRCPIHQTRGVKGLNTYLTGILNQF